MNKHKLSLVLAGVAALVIIVGGWFLGVQPQLATASANDLQRESIDETNASNRAELTRLEEQYQKLGTMKTTFADLQESVPAKADTTGFTREINTAATTSGVGISSVQFDTPVAYAPSAAAGAGATTTGTSTGSPTASASATPSPSATATAAPAAAPAATPAPGGPTTDSSITSADFTVVPVTVAVTGSYQQALAFTKALQNGSRLFLVDTVSQSLSDSSSGGSGGQNWSLGGEIYVLKASSASSSSTDATSTQAAG
ncbi:hypothetical protein DEI92_01685 [Curtobacterium sp. MCBD17_034]|uniref:hypothetical protein n=1 Tax=unclassified Curtobacterium TaxID=257496 RepID=UPI000DAA718E|nr:MULTISPECIES: hypothetical protein [unclassified Curtobacterium]PZF62236.1 hypothetical protein DEI92_01685 [Curtobacterium sp. MCBD17_034]PZM40057.1 hypothetical protein DEI90_04420 [Curtobacterium sp. MCBD17_031]